MNSHLQSDEVSSFHRCGNFHLLLFSFAGHARYLLIPEGGEEEEGSIRMNTIGIQEI